jgi:hypothetical protein
MVASLQASGLSTPRLEVVLSPVISYEFRSREGKSVEVLREYDDLARKLRGDILGEEELDLEGRHPFLREDMGCLGAANDLVRKNNQDRDPKVDDRLHIAVCLYGARKKGETKMYANLNRVLGNLY